MLLRPITTISNADGFDSKKMESLNGLILTARNRWKDKAIQGSIDSSAVTLGFKKVNGALTSGRPYLNNHIISCHAYLKGNSIPEKRWQELIECNSDIKAFTISGSASEENIIDLDIINYVIFKSEGNKIYCSRLQSCSYTFEVLITILEEDA